MQGTKKLFYAAMKVYKCTNCVLDRLNWRRWRNQDFSNFAHVTVVVCFTYSGSFIVSRKTCRPCYVCKRLINPVLSIPFQHHPYLESTDSLIMSVEISCLLEATTPRKCLKICGCMSSWDVSLRVYQTDCQYTIYTGQQKYEWITQCQVLYMAS